MYVCMFEYREIKFPEVGHTNQNRKKANDTNLRQFICVWASVKMYKSLAIQKEHPHSNTSAYALASRD